MVTLERPLFTERLRLEPVTPALAQAALAGQAAFADVIGAEAPSEWCAANLGLVARSISNAWGPAPAPTRAIAIHREEGAVIGDVRFEPSLRAAGEFEIGYSVARTRRRQGYAVEAARVVIDWLFEEAAAESVFGRLRRAEPGFCADLAAVGLLARFYPWNDLLVGAHARTAFSDARLNPPAGSACVSRL